MNNRLSLSQELSLKTNTSRIQRARRCLFTVIFAGLVVAGLLPAQTSEAPVPPRPETITEITVQSSDSDYVAITGTLSLTQAIDLAVKRDPKLHASAWDAESALARIRQARLWPNPKMELERENFGGSGEFSSSDNAEDTLSISQVLPLNGQIKNQHLVAEAQSDQTVWDYHATRLQTILETSRRFVEAAVAERRLALASEELELAKAIENVTANRVDAGDASPVELSRVVVPVVSAELALTNAKLTRDATWRRLALSWGDRHATFNFLSANLDTLYPLPDADNLVDRINKSPQLARWTTEISTREAEHRLARSQTIPNPRLRLGLKKDNRSDDEALVVGISLPLPFFDRNQGETAATQSSLKAAKDRKRAAELQIESSLSSLYLELATAHTEASALQQRAIPAAKLAYEGTRRAFTEGELPYLDVLDTQRTLFELEHRYLDALVAYHTASAELEALLGGNLIESN